MVAQEGSFGIDTTETVDIADVVVVQSARSSVDDEHVRLLAGIAAELPPILVHRPSMRVIDGCHRVRAALLNGATTIRARFFDGSEAEAFVEAIRQNVEHGLPLSLTDRKSAAARLIAAHPSYSNRAIARITGLSDGTVRSLRASGTAGGGEGGRRGRDGRVRPSTAAEGRIRAHEMIQSNPDVPLRTVANRAGVSLGTAHDVRKRLQRGDHPVPPRQRRALGPTRSPGPVEEAAGGRAAGPVGTPSGDGPT
ncbi:ParB/RepB/Spo0J family partition protein, partial [Nocardiopsis sp. RV163]|uniref:ParB/RepB/Spo0J family partition protein n=1 Tax=Nocardiopsis sp. RV163 TaxID=1661388 RepID=UPI00064B9E92